MERPWYPEFQLFSPVLINRTAMQYIIIKHGRSSSEFCFNITVRGFHVYNRVWHLGRCLIIIRAKKEHGNFDYHFVITVSIHNLSCSYAVRKHSDTRSRADDDKPEVGHRLLFLRR
jgi:hypothetical protein